MCCRFAPEKIDQVPQIIRTFDNEEAKLFEALENKYGSRPTFDVAELRYDFSEHKQYAWQDKEVLSNCQGLVCVWSRPG